MPDLKTRSGAVVEGSFRCPPDLEPAAAREGSSIVVSLVLPVYNEADCIGAVVEEARSALSEEFGSAWELVDAVGMRGARSGDAQIAEKHANFIANIGDARAVDVLHLMGETRRRVLEQFGIPLEPEIRFWGFEPDELAAIGVVS